MNKRIPIFLGFLLLTLAVWLQVTSVHFISHFLQRVEALTYDLELRSQLITPDYSARSPIVIVDIDDKSIQKEGRWPWPRAKLAQLTTQLQDAGAVVIVFDMFFPVKENNIVDEVMSAVEKNKLQSAPLVSTLNKIKPLVDNDEIFATSLKKGDTEIGMSFLFEPSTTGILPPPIFTLKTPEEKSLEFIEAEGFFGNVPVLQNGVKSAGFVNVFGDEDGIIRSVPLLIRYKDGVYPSLALQAVSLYLLSDVKLITAKYGDGLRLEGVKVANHIVPTDFKSQVIVPFRGKSFTLPYISATDILNKNFKADAVQGKIIFVGTSATGLGDLKATSVESAYPGVEIQATIADGILTDNFAYKPAWGLGAEVFLTILLGVVAILLFPYCGPKLLALIIIIVPMVLGYFNNKLWEETGIIIRISIPVILTFILALMNIIYGYLFESRRREHLKEMFGQYVPSKHIDEMLKSKTSFGMHGEDREMSVLFADIRNFTTISEKLTAKQLTELLNSIFTPMTEIIFNYQGTIDKYVGDLIMAFWGAPLKDKRHAQHAISAAIDMQKKLDELHAEFKSRDLPEINMGIGINSGVMSVGDMGSKFRRNYTVLGDAVNLASRVESITKMYGVKIIITEFTAHEQKKFVFRRLDRVRVKGKEMAIEILEVVGVKKELSAQLIMEIEMSNSALTYYFAQDWSASKALFAELHKAHPETKFYELYLDRLSEFEKNPPPKDWDGVNILKTK